MLGREVHLSNITVTHPKKDRLRSAYFICTRMLSFHFITNLFFLLTQVPQLIYKMFFIDITLNNLTINLFNRNKLSELIYWRTKQAVLHLKGRRKYFLDWLNSLCLTNTVGDETRQSNREFGFYCSSSRANTYILT